jgi:4-amino-4-deoxy-L-arabinose transferase-like glycosyltransferase
MLPPIRLSKNTLTAAFGTACFVVLALANGTQHNVVPHWAQFSLFYVGILCLIGGFGGGWKAFKALFDEAHFGRNELLLLIALLTLALLLRLWSLGSSIPAPVDEVLPMSEILALWDDPRLPMIQQFGFISSPSRVFASWQAASVAAFGHNLLALRIPSALIGTLTVGAVYLLGRILFDAKTALIAALILATYPPHLHFSRIGLLSIADPLFGTLACAFAAWGFKTNRPIAWALAGAALGLTQYFYEGGRLLFPILITIYVTFTLIRGRASIRQWARGLARCALTACLIAAPVYYTLSRLSDPLSSRMGTMALDGDYWKALLTAPPNSPLFEWFGRHTVDPFLLFITRPDSSPYYGGDTALVLVYLVPAFLLGLMGAVGRSGGWLLLVWFLFTWLGNLLLADSALASRYVLVFPAVALLIALGITSTAAYLPTKHALRLVLVYVGFCAVGQTVYYFGTHLPNFNRQLMPSINTYDALSRVVDLPSGTLVVLVHPPSTMTEEYAQTMLRFLSNDKSVMLVNDLTAFDLSRLPEAESYAFFVPPNDAETPQLLDEFFDLAPQYAPNRIPNQEAYILYAGS